MTHENYQKSHDSHYENRIYNAQNSRPPHNEFPAGYLQPDPLYPPQGFTHEFEYPHQGQMFSDSMQSANDIGKEYRENNFNQPQNYFQQANNINTYANLRTTDRLLPIANISKIMKGPIPKLAKVAKDSKEIMQKAASEFIAIVTCLAKDICEQENRKTLTGEDLIKAMEQLGMEFYANLGRVYMKRYREMGKTIKRRQYDSLPHERD